MTYRFVDCRFDLVAPEQGEAGYLQGHVPGAAFLDLDRDLSDLSDAPARGRHPLPSRDAFAAAAGRAGIGADTLVVAYDLGQQGGAARLWWLLRHFGHDGAAVLGGGLAAWHGPLSSGPETIEPARFVPREREHDTIEADELLDRLGDPRLCLLDARSPERYRGEAATDPLALLDPVGGHIPGARNLWHATIEAGIPPEILEADELAVYCGSGVTACVNVLALARAGRDDARLYVGSWSEWSRRGLPAETGAGR